MIANRIIQEVLQQPDLDHVNEPDLEQLVSDYPYFTAARLLLAKKVYGREQQLQEAAIKKALLYTHHPHLLYDFVSGTNVRQHIPVHTAGTEDLHDPAAAETPVIVEVMMREYDPARREAAGPIEAVTVTADDMIIQDDAIPEIVHIDAAAVNTPEAANSVAETALTPEIAETPAVANTITATPATPEAIAAPVIANTVEETAVTNSVAETAQTPEVSTPETITAAETRHTTIAPPPVETPATGQSAPVAAISDPTDDSAPIKIFPLTIHQEEATTDTLTFQPLYTEDYFAYKKYEDPKADELNAQGQADMKSFTAWLREMKESFAGKSSRDWYHQQLHHMYEDETPEVSETVEKMAMSSITFNNDIVSETLAEIWVRQHQYKNAIQIYQKLSLLNPDKNAYFAQKIKELQLKTDKNKQ